MSNRERIMELIRNEYDPAPSYFKMMGDDWDDGAGRIADAILADQTLLLRNANDDLVAALESARDFIDYEIPMTGRKILPMIDAALSKAKS